MRFEDALTEEDDFDLLVMGRTQEKAAIAMSMVSLQAQLQNIRIIILYCGRQWGWYGTYQQRRSSVHADGNPCQ